MKAPQHRRIGATENLTVVFPCGNSFPAFLGKICYVFPNPEKNQSRNRERENTLEHMRKNYAKVFEDPKSDKNCFRISF
jgi:hypothetical protein